MKAPTEPGCRRSRCPERVVHEDCLRCLRHCRCAPPKAQSTPRRRRTVRRAPAWKPPAWAQEKP